MENSLLQTFLLVPGYEAITNISKTGPGPPHTLYILTHLDYYMDDMIEVVQGGAEQHFQVFDSTLRDLKWIFPPLPGGTKDLAIMKISRWGMETGPV